MPDTIKLLIVDDEAKFLDSIAERLRMRGFDVTKAINGNQALEAAQREKFDLALLDLKMPGMDGQQVLVELKKRHKYLEIIILTGHGSLDSAVECTKLGAFGYLPKPYEMERLLDVLQKAFETRLVRKFESDQAKKEEIMKKAVGSSPLAILRELRQLDNEEK